MLVRVSLSALNGVGRSRQDVGERCFSVPISKRIRQTFGDKLPLLTSDTQEET